VALKSSLSISIRPFATESTLPIWSWSIHDGTFLPIVQAVDTLRALVRADPNAISPGSAENLRLGTLALANPQQWQKLHELEQEKEQTSPRERGFKLYQPRARKHHLRPGKVRPPSL